MNTTIIIVTFKGQIIHECLKNLQRKYKVIIIENSNNKNFKKKIEKSFKNVKCYLSGSNLGFGRANNIGLKKVKTKFSLILNPDVLISVKQVKELENFAKKNKNFSIITPNCNGLLDILKNNSDKLENTENRSIEYLKKKIVSLQPFEINFIPGYCMFVNMQDIKKIKYFDENFFLYFEDCDLCKRLKKLGKKFYILSKVKIHHFYGGFYENKEHYGKFKNIKKNHKNWQNYWAIRNWHLYWSSFYYHRKHYGFLKSFIVHFSKFLRFSLLKIFYFLINNKTLYNLFKARSEGLLYQILNKSAFFGPRVD